VQNQSSVDENNEEEGEAGLKGVVTGSASYGSTGEGGAATAATTEEEPAPGTWKINIVLAFISAWYAMILTGW
jgi:hypothetical protein